MKRLRDTEGGSPLLHRARVLIDAVEPMPDSDARMHRIRRELDRPRGRAAGMLGLRRLPALVIAGLVAMFGASAFAAVRYFVLPAVSADEVQGASAAASRARRAHRGRAAPDDAAPQVTVLAPQTPSAEALVPTANPAADEAVPARSDAPATPTAPAVVPAPSALAVPAAALPHAHGRSRSTRETVASNSKRTASERTANTTRAEARTPAAEATSVEPAPFERAGSDSELVHRAVQALRRDHDPALAARLLQEHRAHYPAGPLAEEALSLQVEAALALHDTGRAQALAQQYLGRYPDGRYSRVVARALTGASP